MDYSWKNIGKRKGRFYVTRMIYHHDFHALQLLLRTVVVMDTTSNFMLDRLEYFAHGPQFDEIEDGTSIPLYDVVLKDEGGFNASISFQRSDEEV